jgi:hypothetical protein
LNTLETVLGEVIAAAKQTALPARISDSENNITENGQTIKDDGGQVAGQISGGSSFAHVEGQQIHIDNRTYNADLDIVKRLVREELKLAHSEYGESVSRGLDALADLMEISEVKEAVFTFRADFQAASNQIDVIANYKALHDVLHTLEFQCYGVIVPITKGFPKNDNDVEQLMSHEMTLQDLLTELQAIIARETIANSEIQWLADLQKAQTELNKAIEDLEAKALRRTILLLNRVLATQPDRINTKLIEATRALRLPDLVEAMQFIAEKLADTGLNSTKLEQFEQGVAVLSTLNQRLTALVIGHDYWQTFDRELRRIESTLSQDLMELEMFWPDLQDQANNLLDANADDWTKDFQKDSQNLDTAIQAQNPAKIRGCFRRYRRRASQRVFQVDVTLKRLCEELRDVGGPLALVLKILE